MYSNAQKYKYNKNSLYLQQQITIVMIYSFHVQQLTLNTGFSTPFNKCVLHQFKTIVSTIQTLLNYTTHHNYLKNEL